MRASRNLVALVVPLLATMILLAACGAEPTSTATASTELPTQTPTSVPTSLQLVNDGIRMTYPADMVVGINTPTEVSIGNPRFAFRLDVKHLDMPVADLQAALAADAALERSTLKSFEDNFAHLVERWNSKISSIQPSYLSEFGEYPVITSTAYDVIAVPETGESIYTQLFFIPMVACGETAICSVRYVWSGDASAEDVYEKADAIMSTVSIIDNAP